MKLPSELKALMLNPLGEALARYPLAGFVRVLPPGQGKGPPLAEVSWAGGRFEGFWIKKVLREQDRGSVTVVLPRGGREARLGAIALLVEGREDCWTRRMALRIQALARKALFLKGFPANFEDLDSPFRFEGEIKKAFKRYCTVNLFWAKAVHPPLWIWEGGWRPTPSWKVGEELRVPALQIASWNYWGEKAPALFLTPLGFLKGKRELSPKEVLVRQGLDPLWAEEVERGEEEAVKRLKEFVAMNLLIMEILS